MNIVRHGLSIGIERIGPVYFVSLKITGKLTHDDYEVIVPMLESALQGIEKPCINALVDLTDMEDWELQAAWDDLKLGMNHGSEFKKIAVVGHRRWMKFATSVGSWFMSGKAEFFENMDNARRWLCEDDREHLMI